jgi:hypothetical protein
LGTWHEITTSIAIILTWLDDTGSRIASLAMFVSQISQFSSGFICFVCLNAHKLHILTLVGLLVAVNSTRVGVVHTLVTLSFIFSELLVLGPG